MVTPFSDYGLNYLANVIRSRTFFTFLNLLAFQPRQKRGRHLPSPPPPHKHAQDAMCGFSYRRATGVQNLIRTLDPVSKGCASHTRYHMIVHALETFGHPRFAVCRHSGAEYEPPPMHPNVGKSCRHAMTAQRTRVGRMRSHARLPRCPRAGGAAHGRGTHAAPTRAPCLQLSRLGHAAGHCREAVRAGLLHESCEPAHDK